VTEPPRHECTSRYPASLLGRTFAPDLPGTGEEAERQHSGNERDDHCQDRDQYCQHAQHQCSDILDHTDYRVAGAAGSGGDHRTQRTTGAVNSDCRHEAGSGQDDRVYTGCITCSSQSQDRTGNRADDQADGMQCVIDHWHFVADEVNDRQRRDDQQHQRVAEDVEWRTQLDQAQA
jgi:hypothetical protein